jgi:RES domain
MDAEQLNRVLRLPAVELGPPRGRLAKAGRMNASGVSVFYGALDEVTCIAEIRPPVGSRVVTGRFEVIRPLRLLDLDALTGIYEPGSYFDTRYGQNAARFSFLRSLGEILSRPVLPGDEEFDYLPTQVIAEYLASRRKLDGIVFHSAQTGHEGQNVVLFHEASVVEPYDLPPGTEIDIDRTFEEDPDHMGRGYETITIWEAVPSDEPSTTASDEEDVRRDEKRTLDFRALLQAPEPPVSDVPMAFGEPSLRLDVQHIEVSTIRAVQYDWESGTTRRHRWTKRDVTP